MQIQKRLSFTKGEFVNRVDNVRKAMSEKGIDVLLIHIPENIYYLSGYQTPGYYAYQALILPLEKDPILVTRLLESSNVIGFSWFEHNRSYTDMEDPIGLTAKTLNEMGVSKARIGTERSCWYVTINQAKHLSSLLPEADWMDASGVVESFRAVKSPAEIAYIKRAAQVASTGMQAGLEMIQQGCTERKVAAAIYAAMFNTGGDEMGMPVFVSAGNHTMLVHHTVYSDNPFKQGDVVFIELSACVSRYSAALLRCAFIGQVEQEIMRRAQVNLDALRAALDILKPGVTSGQVHEAWRSAVEKGGYKINKRAGYSMGITFSPDWGEGYLLDLKADDPTVLVPGMTFHIPSSIRISGRQSVGVSETVLVTDKGYEILTQLPMEFPHK